MVCDMCGKSGARQRYISRSYGEGESLLVIEGVPVISCPHCGESYLTAHTLHEIERIKRQREGVATKRPCSSCCFCITRVNLVRENSSLSFGFLD